MIIWPIILASTFFDTKLAVGRVGKILGYGNVLPTTKSVISWHITPGFRHYALVTAMGMMMNRSMYKNCACVTIHSAAGNTTVLTWKSPNEDANEYSNVTVVNWIREYNAL